MLGRVLQLILIGFLAFSSQSALGDSEDETWAVELSKVTLRVNPDYTFEEIRIVTVACLIQKYGQAAWLYEASNRELELV